MDESLESLQKTDLKIECVDPFIALLSANWLGFLSQWEDSTHIHSLFLILLPCQGALFAFALELD